MRYTDYINAMNEQELADYAARAGTTPGYIQAHIRRFPPRKTPRRDLLNALFAATEGCVDWDEFLSHFYPNPSKDQQEPVGNKGRAAKRKRGEAA